MADHVNIEDPQHRLFAGASMHGYGSYQYPQAQEQQFNAESWPAIDPGLALEPASNSTPATPLASQAWHHSSAGAPSHIAPNAAFSTHGNAYYGGVYSHSASPFQGNAYQPPSNYGTYQTQLLDPSLGYSSSTPPATSSITRPNQSIANKSVQAIAPQSLQNPASYTPNPQLANRPPTTQPYPSKTPAFTAASAPAPTSHSAPPVQSAPPAPPPNLAASLPPYKDNGRFNEMDFQTLVSVTASRRLHEFVTISAQPHDMQISKSVIPNYNPRKSQNEILALANGDEKILSKLAKQKKRNKVFAPKAARTKDSTLPRLSSDVKSPASVSSSEPESSEGDSEYDSSGDELDIVEEAPLPPNRPQSAREAVRYDTIKAVWLPRSRPTQADQIRKALGGFWEVAKTIRDRWKSDNEAVKKAEEAKKISEVPLLKDRVVDQREMMQMVLQNAAEHGHPEVISRFSENLHFLACCASFLIDRNRESDWNGVLARSVLDILSRCSTLTPEKLEKTNLGKVLKVYGKKGDDKTKSLISKISDAARSSSKTKADSPVKHELNSEAGKDVEKRDSTSAAKVDSSKKLTPEPVAGTKRARVGDGAGQPAKRPTSSGTASVTTAPSKTTATTAGTKRPGTTATTTATAAAAPKAKIVPAKPSGFFSSLQSASKKPGTSIAEQAAAKKDGTAGNGASIKKAPAAGGVSAPAKSTFSFMETMANLTKPKEPEKKEKVEETRPAETEEEKTKRLRKEARRRLRVTWKPESELVQVRLFTHDPDEELGHDANMVRDAGDIGGEGRMFKQHKDMMDIDDDDDLANKEETMRPFHTPILIDFSGMNKDASDSNFAPYGGGTRQPNSLDSAVQQAREANELMVFYTSREEIPPCPREPTEPYTGEPVVTRDFGTVPGYVADRSARYLPATSAWQSSAMSATTNVSAILAGLGIPPTAPQPVPQPQPQMQASTTSLENIFKQFGAQQPAIAAFQTQQPFQQQVAAPSANPSLSEILASLSAHNQATQTPPQQPQAQLNPLQAFQFASVPTGPAASAPSATDLSSLLAGLAANPPQPQPIPPTGPALDLQALGLGNLGSLLGGQQGPSPPTAPAAMQANWNNGRAGNDRGVSGNHGLDYDDDDDGRPNSVGSGHGQPSGGKSKKKKKKKAGKKKWSWQD